MAVTAWEAIAPSWVPGSPVASPGVVVNGGGAATPAGPTHGRGYPRT